VIDRFRARVVAVEPIAIAIQEIVKKLGLTISEGKGKRRICAIQRAESAHLKFKNLEETLTFLRDWDPEDPAVLDGDMIYGFSRFFALYPKADKAHLRARLDSQGASKVQSKISRREVPREVSLSEAAVDVLREEYNKSLRADARLPARYAAQDTKDGAA
jgi:hypothetical protein